VVQYGCACTIRDAREGGAIMLVMLVIVVRVAPQTLRRLVDQPDGFQDPVIWEEAERLVYHSRPHVVWVEVNGGVCFNPHVFP
jgi:hypothetical protein